MKRYVLYTLDDPRDGAPRYVGVTSNPNTRALSHCSTTQAVFYNPRKAEWINDLKSYGLRPHLTIVRRVSEANRFAQEEKYFLRLLRNGNKLLNASLREKKLTRKVRLK